MTPNEILTQARELIIDPIAWHPLTEEKSCYCAATAIWKTVEAEGILYAAKDPDALAAGKALAKAAGIRARRVANGWQTIWAWNDNATHLDVIAAFDQAIKDTE
jgi:hypothetical protein